jgi:uncharacterized protein YfaP (DUF2135 family)
LDLDLRIVLNWDTDMTDIDWRVVEPSGEEAKDWQLFTIIGGLVYNNFAPGYGPEVYCLRQAMKGKYKIRVDYFRNPARTVIGPVTLQVDIFTNYGRPNEKRRTVTRRLKSSRMAIEVAEIEL